MSNSFDQFINITSSDAETALYYLEAAGQDLDTAVQLYFDNGGVSVGAAASNNNNARPINNEPIYIPPEEVPAPAPQVAQRLIDNAPPAYGGFNMGGFAPNMNPFAQQQFIPNNNNFNLQPHHQPAIPTNSLFSRQQQQQQQAPPQQPSGSSNNSNRQDMFNKLFAQPTSIMFKGTFDAAKDAAKSQSKWLLVHLHDTTDFHSLRLNRDTWVNDVLSTVIETYFIFYQADVATPEGKKLQQLYHEKSFFVGIIDPRTGEKTRAWYDFMSPKQLNEELLKFCDTHIMEQFSFAQDQNHDDEAANVAAQLAQAQAQFTANTQKQPAAAQQAQRQVSFQVPTAQQQAQQQQVPIPQESLLQGGGDYVDEDAELAMAIAASLESYGAPAQMLQEPIMPRQEVKPVAPPMQQVQQAPPIVQEEEAPQAAAAAEENFPDKDVDPDQYVVKAVTPTATRLQLKMPDGNRKLYIVQLAAPLAVIYALFRRNLPEDQASKKFTVLFDMKDALENSLTTTIEDMHQIRSAALTIRMDD